MPELPIEYSNDVENHLNNTTNASDEVILSIPSDASYVRVVRLAVMGIASRMPFSFEDIEDIKLAVSEACNNAILHARPSSGDSTTPVRGTTPVIVRLMAHTDRLVISVEDHGVIAPPGLMRPTTTDPSVLGDLPEGGMGLFLIETLMDQVEHETGEKTVVRMTKYVSQAEQSVSPTRRRSNVTPSSEPNSTKKPSAAQ
jgi:serine/threonine-protein kinase RsbW